MVHPFTQRPSAPPRTTKPRRCSERKLRMGGHLRSELLTSHLKGAFKANDVAGPLSPRWCILLEISDGPRPRV